MACVQVIFPSTTQGRIRLMPHHSRLHMGCAVWSYKGWNGDFYPEGTLPAQMLPLYTQRMSAVEGNTTFYAIPSDMNIERWCEAMPPGFKFCPKLYKGFTHDGALMRHHDELHRLHDRLNSFEDNLGVVMLQLPPSYGPENLHDLSAFVQAWRGWGKSALSVELRHTQWWDEPYASELQSMLVEHDIGRVLLDTRTMYDDPDDPQRGSQRRKPNVPLRFETSAQEVIVRYIGHPVLERNRPYLEAWREWIARWLEQGLDVYFFAHCPKEEHSPHIARAMHRMLTRWDMNVPEFGWDNVPSEPEQTGLFGV